MKMDVAEMEARKDSKKMLKEAEDRLQSKLDEVKNEQKKAEMDSARNIDKA